MSWNNRIVERRTKEGTFYGLHEVFYNDKNEVCGMTTDALCGSFDNPKELIADLEQKLRDAKKSRKDILKYDMKFAKADWS